MAYSYTLLNALNRLRVRWRRWRLLRAYMKVFKVRRGKSVGITPIMAAYEAAADDGLLKLEDGNVVWYWPEDAPDVEVTD